MKKYILSLLVIAIVCVAGCGLKAHNNDSHYINAEQEGNDSEKMLYEILQCFNNKDADRLKGMFAPDIKDKYDIDGQINYAFKMYNGESVYDGEVRNGGIASSTIKDGIYIEKTVDAVLNGIKTDQEETFRITIIRRVVDDAVPQAVGLEKIYLQDGDYKAKAVIGKTYRGEETDIRQQNQTFSDDVDETALSFAEIKALCAGDPRIKERMDLDVEVSRLKLMKADHQSKQYCLEDQLLKYFPEEIEKHKGFIKGFESDLEVLAAHPHPEDGFAGMEIRGDLLTDKENAGAALLDACKEVKTSDPVQIGSYRGYAMSVEFSAWKQEYTLLLKGQMTHRATLGADPRGNLTRIDNALAQMPQRLEAAKAQLDNLCQQQAAAKEEVGKPFLYEEELRSKNARLVELDTLLNIDGKGQGQAHTESAVAKSTRPSVLDHLKRPVPPRSTDKKPKQHEEVR